MRLHAVLFDYIVGLLHSCIVVEVRASPFEWFDFTSCAPQQTPVFGCSENSTLLVIEYPGDLGTMTCGDIYSLSQPALTPPVTVASSNSASIHGYSLLLVDTSTLDLSTFQFLL
jgi:hypothetical protein